MHSSTFLADLAIVLGVAAATSVVARLVRQPSILGYLLAGLIVGPYIPFPLFADPERVQALADFGVVLVMFAVGIEFRIAKLVRLVPLSGLTVIVEVSLLMWFGLTVGRLLHWSAVESVFLGAVVAISSTMVVSKVYDERPVAADVREYVFGILVIQDVVAILLIAALTGVAATGNLSPQEVVQTLAKLSAVLVGMLVLGLVLVPRLVRAVVRLESSEILSVFSIGICFVIARLAELLGFSLALGAFVAGVLVAESGRAHPIEERIRSVRDMFAAIFFVSIGMTVDPAQVVQVLPVALLVSAVVVLGQLGSVSGIGVLSGNGLRRSLVAGLSLGQIGEFSFILSAIGASAGVVKSSLQPMVVTVAVITTFTTPVLVGSSDRVVGWVDRLLPRRLRHLLGLHQEWVERLRSSATPAETSPARRALRAIFIDGSVLILVLGLAVFFFPELSHWLSHRFSVSPGAVRLWADAVVALISIPILAALIRNLLALSRIVGRSISPQAGIATRSAKVAAHAASVLVYLLALVGVGLPAIVVLQPLAGGIYAVVLLVAAVGGVGLLLWKRAGEVENEYESGVGKIAATLARHAAEETPEILSDPSLLPGLDSVVRVSLSASDAAVGRTLTELNLRALTGATVVAIHRERGDSVLPTGRERLEAGDVLALTGTTESLQDARNLLERPTPNGDGSDER